MNTKASKEFFDGKLTVKDGDPVVLPKTDWVFEDDLKQYPEDIVRQYKYDTFYHKWYLPEKTWLMWREHGPKWFDKTSPEYIKSTINGSASSCILTMDEVNSIHLYDGQKANPWSSIIEYFYQKEGIELPLRKAGNSLAFFLGHVEEESVRQEFAYSYLNDYPYDEIQVINDTHMYQSKTLPFCLYNPDGIIIIKTTNPYTGNPATVKLLHEDKISISYNSPNRKLWDKGIVPFEYYIQVCFGMMVMNLPGTYISAKLDIGRVVYAFIERNMEVEAILKNACIRFYNAVIKGEEPDYSDIDTDSLIRFYKEKAGYILDDDKEVKLPPDALDSLLSLNKALERKKDLQSELKTAEKDIEEATLSIWPYLLDNARCGTLDYSGGTIRVELKPSRKSFFDEQQFKLDHKDLWEKFKYTEKFNEKKFKSEYAALYEEYSKDNRDLGSFTPKLKFINKKGD